VGRTRDFDQIRAERAARTALQAPATFRLGGHEFRLVASIHPDVVAIMDEVDTSKPGHVLRAIDDVVDGCLDAVRVGDGEWSDHATASRAWQDLRARRDDPLTVEDITSIMQFCIEELTGRPTGQPADSSDGPGTSGTFSTVGSPSPEQTPQA
jgi:hypothetical protein